MHLRAKKRGDVGLKFEFKMLEFVDFVNLEFKHDKDKRAQQDKMIELFMMQNAISSSPTNRLAKVNMPSSFMGLGKAKKIKNILLKIDNYYYIKRPKEDDKIFIVMTFLKDHALQ